MQIDLKNYQSIRKGSIEIKGLTGVVGGNNSGKTAIMRAVKDFADNSFSKDKIYKDEKESTITINGVTLKRTIPTTTLIQNGEETVKLEGKNIVQLTGNKDFLIIDTDKIKDFFIQFLFQRESLPPFDLSNTQLYYLFSMMFDMETLNKLFLYCKETVKENESELKYLKGKLDEILKQKSRIDSIKEKLPDTERLHKLEYKYSGISKLLSDINRKSELEQKISELNSFKKKINPQIFIQYKLVSIYDIFRREKNLKNLISVYNFSLINLKVRLLRSIKEKYKVDKTILLSYLLNEINKKKNIQQKNLQEIKLLKSELSKFERCPLCLK